MSFSRYPSMKCTLGTIYMDRAEGYDLPVRFFHNTGEFLGGSASKPITRGFFCALLVFALLLPSVCTARTLFWAGKNWIVKDGNNLGPGPNHWSDSTNNVWVDTNGYLHLKITEDSGSWYCAEIISEQSFGYGEYRFQIDTRVDLLDTNTVGGLFTYLDDDNEIDIEFVRIWTGPTNNASFATQPSSEPGNIMPYHIALAGDLTTHRFAWETNSILYQSYNAHGDVPPATNLVIAEWTYAGGDIPLASDEKVHLNLWLFQGNAPTDMTNLELVVRNFIFTPSTNSHVDTSMAGFFDDFNDQVLSNAWSYGSLFGEAELNVETNGTMRVHPPGDEQDQTGIVTVNPLTWQGNDSSMVFQAEIDWIDVTQPGTTNGIDVKAMMAAVSSDTSPFFATNAAILLGAYQTSNDLLEIAFHTKSGSPASMGTEVYTGVVTHASTYLGNGGLTLGFELDAGFFEIFALDQLGNALELHGSSSNNIGVHGLGTDFTNAHFALGGQNWWDADGFIYYDQVHVFPSNGISTNIPPPPPSTNVVMIGLDTSGRNDPIRARSEQNRVQTFYRASEIRWTGTLTHIALDVSDVPQITQSNFTIRVQHFWQNVMTQAWVTTGWTVVYQDDVDFASNGWHHFILTNDFYYNGSSNLLIDFSKSHDGTDHSGEVRWTKTGDYRTYRQFIDNSTDPLTWSGQLPLRNGSRPPHLSTRHPDVILTFGGTSDSDGDGLPDAWELQYAPNLTNMNGSTDLDGDGALDVQEYRAGTHPTNSASVLEALTVEETPGGCVIRWSSSSNRLYEIQRAENMTNLFIGLMSNLPATPPENAATDTTAVSDGPYYYRIRVDEE